jgi:nondiscriminating glutamyl-tRNA synthetase
VGGARTALYCYLYAQRTKGTFILRVEDTDQERSTEESMKMQLGDLEWLGLNWDEGPYRQSERMDIYKDHAEKLLEAGKAYYCFLTDEELEAQREQNKAKGIQHIQSPFRDSSLEEAKKKLAAGEKAVVRFKTPEAKTDYVLTDLVRGEVTFPSDMIGDFVLLRSDGMPVYNFCCVVDDALMKMTHVLRAEEHLPNTLRQMMIYEALGFPLPQFGHMSIILGEDKQKLSKRHGATSIHEYKENGYLPEALNNFLALLGWSSPNGDELMSMAQLKEQFDLDRLNASPAVFDETKLKWMNGQHLRELEHKELWWRIKPFLDHAGVNIEDEPDPDWIDKALGTFKTRMEVLTDAIEMFRPLDKTQFKVAEESKEVLGWAETKSVVEKWIELIESHSGDTVTEEDFAGYQNTIKESCGVKGKTLFMPIRVAIIGKPHGAELKELVPLMTKNELLKRAKDVHSNL